MRGALVFGAAVAAIIASGLEARAAESALSDCAGVGGVSSDKTSGWTKVRSEAKRVNFVKGPGVDARCPGPFVACREASYVVGGDGLLLGPLRGQYVCARFVGLRQSVEGWLPTAELEPMNANFFPTWWDGFWSSRDDYPRRITIEYIDGVSFKISAELNGVVLAGAFKPSGDRAEFAIGEGGAPSPAADAGDKACVLRLRIAGPYLLVEAGERCGVAQFGGIYGH